MLKEVGYEINGWTLGILMEKAFLAIEVRLQDGFEMEMMVVMMGDYDVERSM